jgi:hypothetical protein
MQRRYGIVAGSLMVGLMGALLFGCAPGSVGAVPTQENCANNIDDDYDGDTDCADSQCVGAVACLNANPDDPNNDNPNDPTPADPPVDTPPVVAEPVMQVVMDQVKLPKSSSEYAADINGDGVPDNRLGEIISVLDTFLQGLDLQAETDYSVKSGMTLILMEILGSSLINDAATSAQVYRGSDSDTAADNFSGSEDFGISSEGPQGIKLTGKVVDGRLDVGPGNLVVPLPLVPGKPPIPVTLYWARIEGDIGPNGITNGRLTGALPKSEIESTLMPALAETLTWLIGANSTPAYAKSVLSAFDTDKDGKISGGELQNSVIGTVLKGDLHGINGEPDSEPDALSLGIGFNAVNCTIQK